MMKFIFLILLLTSTSVNASCIPSGTAGDDTVTCTGNINAWQRFYGGNDHISLIKMWKK